MGVMPVPSTVVQLGEEFVYWGWFGRWIQDVLTKTFLPFLKNWERKGRVPAGKWGVKEKGGDLIL